MTPRPPGSARPTAGPTWPACSRSCPPRSNTSANSARRAVRASAAFARCSAVIAGGAIRHLSRRDIGWSMTPTRDHDGGRRRSSFRTASPDVTLNPARRSTPTGRPRSPTPRSDSQPNLTSTARGRWFWIGELQDQRRLGLMTRFLLAPQLGAASCGDGPTGFTTWIDFFRCRLVRLGPAVVLVAAQESPPDDRPARPGRARSGPAFLQRCAKAGSLSAARRRGGRGRGRVTSRTSPGRGTGP